MKHFEKYFPIYQKILDKYENDHPNWQVEVLVSLIKWSLRSLKHYIEDVQDPKITWESPFVELHYPMDWNWKGRGTGDIAPGGHVYGTFNARNTATKKLAAKTISQIMTRHLNAMTLADATNWAWFEKLNNHYTPVFPVQITTDLLAIEDKRRRRDLYDELIRPFSIGATRIDADVMKLKSGMRIPKRFTRQQRMDINGIRFNGEVNGHKFDMGLVFEIHPLIADYDKKNAYHSVVVGLAVLRQTIGGELVGETPADWSKTDREQFWQELYRTVDKRTDLLIPKTESKQSVILSVNSKIKIPIEHWQPENRSAEMKKITDALDQIGEIDALHIEPVKNYGNDSFEDACPVCNWIHDTGFTQIIIKPDQVITLTGILPEIVALVHNAHATGFPAVSSKDEKLLVLCGGYNNPCKAFDDLNHRNDYKLLFDTRKRGFISLRGANGINRNKSEPHSE